MDKKRKRRNDWMEDKWKERENLVKVCAREREREREEE